MSDMTKKLNGNLKNHTAEHNYSEIYNALHELKLYT